jgi:hypothetical protein
MKSRKKSRIGNRCRGGWLQTGEQPTVTSSEQPGEPAVAISPSGGKRLRREGWAATGLHKSRPGETTRAQLVSKGNRARSPSLFERHRQEMVKVALSVVLPIVFTGVGWLCLTLNREVGEQKQTVAGVLRDVENILDRTKRAEDQLERQISVQAAAFESLRSKLDDLRELVSGAGRLPVARYCSGTSSSSPNTQNTRP